MQNNSYIYVSYILVLFLKVCKADVNIHTLPLLAAEH